MEIHHWDGSSAPTLGRAGDKLSSAVWGVMLNTAFLSCLLHVLHCPPLLFFFRYKFIIFWSVLQEKKKEKKEKQSSARLSSNDTTMHKRWNEQKKKVFYCIGLKLKLYYGTQGIVFMGDLAAHYNQGCTILLSNTYATLLLKRLTCFNLIFFSWFSWPSMNYFYFVCTECQVCEIPPKLSFWHASECQCL